MDKRTETAIKMIPSETDIPLAPAPITPSWVREGNPQARNAVLSRSSDGLATTIVWECTAGKFEWIYDIDETIYFIEGAAIISDGHSPPRRFGPGDVLFLPRGTVAFWHVEEYVRKVAFCRVKLPKPLEFWVRGTRKIKRMVGADRDKSGGLMNSLLLPLTSCPLLLMNALNLTETFALA